MNGYFISFEGTDGSGKTTLIEEVMRYLNEKGFDCVKTREPGGVKIAEEIRDIIHDVNNTEMDSLCEAFLYAASRRQHLMEKVVPMTKEGKIVICDRYIDSSLAYQGHARGLGIERVRTINEYATEKIYPDLTIYVDVRPEEGIRRIMANQDTHEVNRMDRESIEFHKRVYEGYDIVRKMYPDRIVSINGEQTREKVAQDTIEVLKGFLEIND